MIGEQIIFLRKRTGMSQEELASLVGVSRQTLSKWETGESIPDIAKAGRIAQVFDVSLDSLVDETTEEGPMKGPAPRGKHAYGLVRVGDKGQIVIPARARKQFGIEPGDNLIVLGDEATGLALISEKRFMKMMLNMQQPEGQNNE